MRTILLTVAVTTLILVGAFFAFNSYIYNEKQADTEEVVAVAEPAVTPQEASIEPVEQPMPSPETAHHKDIENNIQFDYHLDAGVGFNVTENKPCTPEGREPWLAKDLQSFKIVGNTIEVRMCFVDAEYPRPYMTEPISGTIETYLPGVYGYVFEDVSMMGDTVLPSAVVLLPNGKNFVMYADSGYALVELLKTLRPAT